jgi:hypothetical protein
VPFFDATSAVVIASDAPPSQDPAAPRAKPPLTKPLRVVHAGRMPSHQSTVGNGQRLLTPESDLNRIPTRMRQFIEFHHTTDTAGCNILRIPSKQRRCRTMKTKPSPIGPSRLAKHSAPTDTNSRPARSPILQFCYTTPGWTSNQHLLLLLPLHRHTVHTPLLIRWASTQDPRDQLPAKPHQSARAAPIIHCVTTHPQPPRRSCHGLITRCFPTAMRHVSSTASTSAALPGSAAAD